MSIVYHYCSIETLKSILESKTIWLCDLTKSNDSEEVVRCFQTLWNYVKDKLRKSDLDSALIEQQIKNLDPIMYIQSFSDIPYGCSFCKKKDLVQQWQEYGDKGKGVSIGFDIKWFPIMCDFPITSRYLSNAIAWNNVIYESDSFKSFMFKACYESIKKLGNTAWIKEILPTFKHYSGFYKNPTFEGEQEVRIVYYPEDEHDRASIGLNDISTYKKPHYALSWIRNNSIAIKTITLGYECEISEPELYKLLEKYGVIHSIAVDKSICSYTSKAK